MMQDKEASRKISIIIPVYNAEKFLAETIDSILKQSYQAIELILVNDGSADGSQSIINEYQKKDSRIISFATKNMGAPHARNIGLDKATGDFILFFDADDVMLPDALQRLLDGFNTPGTELVIGSRFISKEDGRVFDKEILKEGVYNPESKEADYLGSILPVPDNKLYLSKILKENGIRFADLRMAQDLNVYLKYLSVCGLVHVLSEPVCTYRIVEGSISHTNTDKKLDVVKCARDVQGFAAQKDLNPERRNMIIGACMRHYFYQIEGAGVIAQKDVRSRIIDGICSSAKKVMEADKVHSGSDAELYYRKIYFVQAHSLFYKSQLYYYIRCFRHRLRLTVDKIRIGDLHTFKQNGKGRIERGKC